jgi:hypothetical protein
MSDAITNLGGGGLKTPWLANLATSGNYALSSVTTLIGGPLINKFGIKWSCIIAAIAMPLAGSSYYCSARFGLSSYLLSARVSPVLFPKTGRRVRPWNFPSLTVWRGRFRAFRWSVASRVGSFMWLRPLL